MNKRNRIINEANYIIDNDATIRKTGKVFNISKSLVHKDIHLKLKNIDYELYKKTTNILKKHYATKHILGGLSTKLKYKRG